MDIFNKKITIFIVILVFLYYFNFLILSNFRPLTPISNDLRSNLLPELNKNSSIKVNQKVENLLINLKILNMSKMKKSANLVNISVFAVISLVLLAVAIWYFNSASAAITKPSSSEVDTAPYYSNAEKQRIIALARGKIVGGRDKANVRVCSPTIPVQPGNLRVNIPLRGSYKIAQLDWNTGNCMPPHGYYQYLTGGKKYPGLSTGTIHEVYLDGQKIGERGMGSVSAGGRSSSVRMYITTGLTPGDHELYVVGNNNGNLSGPTNTVKFTIP